MPDDSYPSGSDTAERQSGLLLDMVESARLIRTYLAG